MIICECLFVATTKKVSQYFKIITMKYKIFLFLNLITTLIFAQESETITVPSGVVYKYADKKIIEKAKKLIADNLSQNPNYKLLQPNLIIGPELWKRYKDNKNIQKIEKGKVTFHVDNLELDGKMSQDLNDSKIIWEEFRKEIVEDYIIRKANVDELKYYWSVISFDIEEPLLIVETKEHNYILNLLKKDLKLLWLDEAPLMGDRKSIKDNGTKVFQNGKEINSISAGIRETKLEKIIFLSSDKELKENTSLEDIKAIVDKTDKVFEDLFKNSEKSGKIMIQFTLNKRVNEVEYAVKNDLDLDIMKEFEKRVNTQVYPNSKKDSVVFQLIYKVNSLNDTE